MNAFFWKTVYGTLKYNPSQLPPKKVSSLFEALFERSSKSDENKLQFSGALFQYWTITTVSNICRRGATGGEADRWRLFLATPQNRCAWVCLRWCRGIQGVRVSWRPGFLLDEVKHWKKKFFHDFDSMLLTGVIVQYWKSDLRRIRFCCKIPLK